MTNTYRRHLGGQLPPPSVRAALDLLCRGYSYTEMARALGRSPHTVKNQLQAGYRMLDCRTGLEAALIWSQLRTGDGAPRAHAGASSHDRETLLGGAETLLVEGLFE